MSKKSRDCLKFLDNLSKNSNRIYKQSIKKYETFHGTTIDALIEEALNEQAGGVAPHLLTIIGRLEDFQESLIQKNYCHNTIVSHMARIKKVYRTNRVSIPYIESVNPKRTRRREYIEYKDVLTKDELRQAIPMMRLPAQARAMVMVSGGLSNEECEHLTTRAFIDELRKYHQCDDDIEALRWLVNPNHPVIWVTKLIRQKTKKPYYALIGSEAVNKIAEAKLYEWELPSSKGKIPSKLLSMSKDGFGRTCRRINKKLGFGLVAEESKLRPHNLRRFNATYIRGSVLSYEEQISLSEIDEMQGRGKTNVQDTYIKSNPLEQKLLYAKVMNNVSLWNEYDYVITHDDVLVYRKDQLKENEKLRNEVKNLRDSLQKKQKASEKVRNLREELGNDVFDEMIGEILNAS